MGLFFSSGGSKIYKEAWKNRVRPALYNAHFDSRTLDKIEGFLQGDMEESSTLERGLDKEEFAERMEWLKKDEHYRSYGLSRDQVNKMEEVISKHFK